jgi:hypothetical protein
MRAYLAAVLLVLGACGGSDISQNTLDAAGSGSNVDAAVPAGWTVLISRPWSLPPNLEGYKCRRIQVPEDMWISAFRVMAPTGTHHEVVTILPSGATGDYDCNAGTGALTNQMLYAAGVGTDDLAFPPGVAIHLAAGTWINLNLHLFNLHDTAASAESGLLVKTIPAADVVHPADMTFAGTRFIDIPNDNQPHTAVGGCSAPATWHVFALWPHMHQIGTHQLFTVTPGGGATTTMLDTSYQFTEQKNYPMAETIIPQGAQVQVTCTYVNNTAAPIGFGDSSTSEMCFTGLYKYPAGGGEFGCVTGF